MRMLSLACAAALMAITATGANAQAPAAAAAKKYSTASTPLGTLLADPATKAVLVKYLPALINSADIAERASGMSLKEVQDAMKAYAPDMLSDATLAKIDAELGALPAH